MCVVGVCGCVFVYLSGLCGLCIVVLFCVLLVVVVVVVSCGCLLSSVVVVRVGGVVVGLDHPSARPLLSPDPPPPDRPKISLFSLSAPFSVFFVGRNRLWPNRLWPSLSDRLWPNRLWPKLRFQLYVKISVVGS